MMRRPCKRPSGRLGADWQAFKRNSDLHQNGILAKYCPRELNGTLETT